MKIVALCNEERLAKVVSFLSDKHDRESKPPQLEPATCCTDPAPPQGLCSVAAPPQGLRSVGGPPPGLHSVGAPSQRLLGAVGALGAAGIVSVTALVIKRARRRAEEKNRTVASNISKVGTQNTAAASKQAYAPCDLGSNVEEGKMEPAVFETADCKAEVQNSSGLKDTPEGMGSERSAHLAPLTPRQEIWEDMRPCTCSNEDAMGNALVFWSGNSGTPLPGREHPPPESSLRGVGENTHPPAPLTPELQVEAAMPVSATFKASMERFAGLIEQQGPQAYIPRFGQRGRVAAVNTSSCKVTSKRQTSAKPAV